MAVEAPENLGSSGRAFWLGVTSRYELRVDELMTLEDICSKSDRISALRDSWEESGCPETTTGSMGQLVAHPIPAQIDKLRMERNTLLGRLKLPDEGASSDQGGELSAKNRAAANARWSKRGA